MHITPRCATTIIRLAIATIAMIELSSIVLYEDIDWCYGVRYNILIHSVINQIGILTISATLPKLHSALFGVYIVAISWTLVCKLYYLDKDFIAVSLELEMYKLFAIMVFGGILLVKPTKMTLYDKLVIMNENMNNLGITPPHMHIAGNTLNIDMVKRRLDDHNLMNPGHEIHLKIDELLSEGIDDDIV